MFTRPSRQHSVRRPTPPLNRDRRESEHRCRRCGASGEHIAKNYEHRDEGRGSAEVLAPKNIKTLIPPQLMDIRKTKNTAANIELHGKCRALLNLMNIKAIEEYYST